MRWKDSQLPRNIDLFLDYKILIFTTNSLHPPISFENKLRFQLKGKNYESEDYFLELPIFRVL